MNRFTINIINIYPEEKVKLLQPMYNQYKFMDDLPRKYELGDCILYNGEFCKLISYDCHSYERNGKIQYCFQSLDSNY